MYLEQWKLLPHSSEGWEVQDQCPSQFSSWWESFLLVDSLLSVSSYGRKRELLCFFLLGNYKIVMTKVAPKDPSSKYYHVGIKASTWMLDRTQIFIHYTLSGLPFPHQSNGGAYPGCHRVARRINYVGGAKGFSDDRPTSALSMSYIVYFYFILLSTKQEKNLSIPRQKPPWNWGHTGPPFFSQQTFIEHLLCVGTGDHGMNEMSPAAPRTNILHLIPYSGDGKKR